MDLNKRFLHFKTKENFLENTPGPQSIAFIQDAKEIWTHGTFYCVDPEYNLSVDTTPDEDGKKYIRLTTKAGKDLGKIDIADFVKDGMINKVEFDADSEDKILTLTFNTDSGLEPIEVSLKGLVDIYDGSNIKLKTVEIPETATEPAANDTVDTAVANLIAKDREIAATAADDLAAAVESLEDAIDAAKTELELAIDDLEAVSYEGIENGTDGDFVTTTITEKVDNKQTVAVEVTTAKITEVSESVDGLAVASDVKAYVTDLFAWEELD